ncbi:flagellin hook IN motif-containing protein, partial [Campylobacter jejuni]|uniref:flagellin hook IN motif-containing protein n=1 Tax=Campylobacter jejuni TaxID=197 RepID=UPI00255C139B
MGFRINTNVAALNAKANSDLNSRALDQSLSRLSSGLRINSAADDASGMAIADSLRSQANTLGQAISNGNDALGILQTADKAIIKASIGATQSSKIGVTRFETGSQSFSSGTVGLTIKNYNGIEDFKFQNVVISTSVGTGLGALAEEINRNADKTGIRATFDVKSVGAYTIKAGNTSQDFAINGVVIGKVDYSDGDENGSLISAINAVKDTTGVQASKDENGKLVLTSADGR